MMMRGTLKMMNIICFLRREGVEPEDPTPSAFTTKMSAQVRVPVVVLLLVGEGQPELPHLLGGHRVLLRVEEPLDVQDVVLSVRHFASTFTVREI